jgi:5'(3')-deoxyribonucleotidase
VTDSDISAVLVDVDGLLADFVSSSLRVAGIPLKHDDVRIWDYFLAHMSETQFRQRIDSTPGYWDDLVPYPWAAELVSMCEAVAPVFFCTDPCGYKGAADAKIEWLIRHGFMGKYDRNYILTPHKWMQAAPNRILIDDSPRNITDFVKHKGIGVLFPQPWNSSTQGLTHASRMEHVAGSLSAAINMLSGKKVYGKDDTELESILVEAERLTGVDRQADYGSPDQDFAKTAGMWTSMWRDKLKPGAKFDTWDVPSGMICIKLSRLQHKPKRDSVVDTAGYANCMDYCYRASGGY